TINHFNQIKGRKMVLHFRNSQLDKVDVFGNGESIYYALEEDTVTVGMNRIICSNMLIKFKESQMNSIAFYTNPDASFFPPHEITKDNNRLQGFSWREEERPKKRDVLAEHVISPVNNSSILCTTLNEPRIAVKKNNSITKQSVP